MKKEIVGAACALAAAVAAIASFPAHAAAGWEMSEDGKHWMYYDDWDEPMTDTWIELEGKTYYLDTKGYMKTGWVISGLEPTAASSSTLRRPASSMP